MKQYFIVIAAAISCSSAVYASVDRPITVSQLPQAAQTFLQTHFAAGEVAYAEMDDDVVRRDYEVVLSDGTKIEFDGQGEWREIQCVRQSVPAALVPKPIAAYVAENYSGEIITEIERGRYKTEVKLSNGLELKFNSSYQLVKVDR